MTRKEKESEMANSKTPAKICDSIKCDDETSIWNLRLLKNSTNVLYTGLCMVLDVVEERGLSDIDLKWGDPNGCHFPLIHGMERPSLPIMIVIYTVMWMGAFGIMLGFCFKLACACFAIPYWYILLLDKSFWNNHSYLYGIVAVLLSGTGANRYFAVDANISREKETSVPLWNYFILKFQFFALYFIAGLKKSSWEWLEGFAMTNLSRHWVFDPFKTFLSVELTDFLIVHWFGFIFDLTIGFWMLFPKTRIPAMVFCTAFHMMNSRLFSIGMFPYVCLATMPLFCNVDWPRKIIAWFTGSSIYLSSRETCSASEEARADFNAIRDPEKNTKRDERDADESTIGSSPTSASPDVSRSENLPPPDRHTLANEDEHRNGCSTGNEKKFIAWRHKNGAKKKIHRVTKKNKFVVSILLLHIALQFFLPYSHFITKGYNNWVPGLYGYSWDMMVHSWDIILVVIRVHDNVNNEDLFMNPQAWVQNDKWAKHGDMVRQHAQCLRDNLIRQKNKILNSSRKSSDIDKWSRLSTNLSVYVDVWCSLNGRFQQRIFDPRVDMLTVDWHPFKPISYLMPLLTEFSSYRYKLDEIQKRVHSWSNNTDVFFVADYPGMRLENFISDEFSNVSVSVLEGSVAYTEEGWEKKIAVAKGGRVPVKTGKFHTITTTSSHPSCYMYTYENQTDKDTDTSGSSNPSRTENALKIVKEFRHRINAWWRALGHIANAFFYLAYDVPMVRRVRNY